ncbi:MAG TPA: 2-C-methyl-D-erythritol 2,4-cyclodiphosphate synthase [bacterium]|nr:2-C-methyl-D-erythritol 2,4-cyclodiphosphate synthase [bacterium]
MDIRVGSGFDAHRFTPGRPLILGGVTVPHDKGLLGHSDADALCHAAADAILGAAALGDLGKFFPDSDPKWKGADSLKILAECARLAEAKGWVLVNLDATLICQKPKLAPYLPGMAQRLAETLGLPLEAVSVKAKTTEGMGFEGREEGLSAQAVVLLKKKN